MMFFDIAGRIRAILAEQGKKPPYAPDDVRAALTLVRQQARDAILAAVQAQPPPPSSP
jgi:hypothetical protein